MKGPVRRCYTLVEMMMVLGVIGLVGGLALKMFYDGVTAANRASAEACRAREVLLLGARWRKWVARIGPVEGESARLLSGARGGIVTEKGWLELVTPEERRRCPLPRGAAARVDWNAAGDYAVLELTFRRRRSGPKEKLSYRLVANGGGER